MPESMLIPSWNRLLAGLGERAAALALRPGSELAALELVVGALPSDYRAWLAIANGQDKRGLSILARGGRLLSIAEVVERWQAERVFDVDDSTIPRRRTAARSASWCFIHAA